MAWKCKYILDGDSVTLCLTLIRPYIFLTNGGGKTEAERCIDLSRQLNIEVSPAQFICGMPISTLHLNRVPD